MDALQYVATRVFGGIVRGYREGMEGLKLPPIQYPDHRIYTSGTTHR